MRKFFNPASALVGLALAMGLGLTGALAQPAQCGRTAVGTSAAATTLVITGVAGQNIHLCGWDVTATAIATFQLVAGTGATCGTGTVNITAPHSISAQNVLSSSGATPGRYSTSPPVPSTNPTPSVCVIVTGTGPVQWTIYYTQF
jgi:hypothetical protein